MRWLVLLFFFTGGCTLTNFPVQQTPPAGMNSAIQQEVIADAIEAAVAEMEIAPEASWESTARIVVTSPFQYDLHQDGEDSGVAGYLRTMIEKMLTEKGFHVVSGDVTPDQEIGLEIRTAGAEVKEEDFVLLQKGTLKAVVSFRVFIKGQYEAAEKPYFIAEGGAVSDPYIWRNTLLYFIGLPGVKYRPVKEPTFWGRFFDLSGDVSAGVAQTTQAQSASPIR